MLPNLSRLLLTSHDYDVGMPLGKRQAPEPDNPFQFIKPNDNIADVNWTQIRQTLSKLYLEKSEPIIQLKFERVEEDGSTTTVSFYMTSKELVMRAKFYDGAECVRLSFPTADKGRVYLDTQLYLHDFFYEARSEEFTCEMSPARGESSLGPNLIMDLLAVIANKTGSYIVLEDYAQSHRIPDSLQTQDFERQKLTSSLWFLRGYGYYEARGFLTAAIDRLIYNYNELNPNLPPDHMFVKVFQIQLDWIHMCMTAPISMMKEKLVAFSQSSSLKGALPIEIVNMFKESMQSAREWREKFDYLERFIESLDKQNANLKGKSIRQLHADSLISVSANPIIEFVRTIPKLWLHEEEQKEEEFYYPRITVFPGHEVHQRTFLKLDTTTGKEIAYRIGVSVADDKSASPIASLVPLKTNISVKLEIDEY